MEPGDVVVPVLGGGSVARVVDEATAGAALGRNLTLLRPDPAALDPWFLAGFLRGTANNRQASSYASTATRLDVRRLQLPRLPLDRTAALRRTVPRARRVRGRAAAGRPARRTAGARHVRRADGRHGRPGLSADGGPRSEPRSGRQHDNGSVQPGRTACPASDRIRSTCHTWTSCRIDRSLGSIAVASPGLRSSHARPRLRADAAARPRPGGRSSLRVLFVAVAVLSCGLLAWACAAAARLVTRRTAGLVAVRPRRSSAVIACFVHRRHRPGRERVHHLATATSACRCCSAA